MVGLRTGLRCNRILIWPHSQAPSQLPVACSTFKKRGPGKLYHVSEVMIERLVERLEMKVDWGSKQQEEKIPGITYHNYPADCHTHQMLNI